MRGAGKIQMHDVCILLLDARAGPPGALAPSDPAPRVSYSVVEHPLCSLLGRSTPSLRVLQFFFGLEYGAAICLLNQEENVCILVLATFFWQYRSLGGSAKLGLTWCHKLSGVWTLSLSATSILNSLAGSKAISESDQKRNETAFIVGIEYAHT